MTFTQIIVILAGLLLALLTSSSAADDHVVMIVVDGLRPDIVQDNLKQLPNFKRLFDKGACTNNARIDSAVSQTTPGFLSIFTGMTVYRANGKCDEDEKKCHGMKKDGNPCEGKGKKCKGLKWPELISEHKNIFKAVGKAKKEFCLFAAKDKFEYFDKQWEISKDGYYNLDKDGEKTTDKFIKKMKSKKPCNFAAVHYQEPDQAGHKAKTKKLSKNKKYIKSIKKVDKFLGKIFKKMESIDKERGTKTSYILTSDHGFAESNHGDETLLLNYRIPFCVMGGGIPKKTDLYSLQDPQYHEDPGKKQYKDWSKPAPIRCHDAGPLAADLLGLPNFSPRQIISVSESKSQTAITTEEL